MKKTAVERMNNSISTRLPYIKSSKFALNLYMEK